MKLSINSVAFSICFGLFMSLSVLAQQSGSLAIGLNRIEGRVTDEANVGVYNAYVELYDNYGSLVSKQRSSGQGRFSFRGMAPGRYTIAVKPYGTNLLEESREIEVKNDYSRSDIVIVDMRLRTDRRFRSNEQNSVIGTVFAQEVPPAAERLYKSGIDNIEPSSGKGFNDLEQAIKLFPTYFNALAALGKANIIAGKYQVGYPYLLRAINVNRRCADCYYSLALAFYKLDEIPAAIQAIDAAVVLQPQVASVRLLQGIVYRLNNDFVAAEKALLMAASLSKDPLPEVNWQLSLVYNRMNRNQDAAHELEKYLKLKHDLTDAEKENVRNLIAKMRGATTKPSKQ